MPKNVVITLVILGSMLLILLGYWIYIDQSNVVALAATSAALGAGGLAIRDRRNKLIERMEQELAESDAEAARITEEAKKVPELNSDLAALVEEEEKRRQV